MALRLAILDPGHFHAALPLRSRNQLLADTVQVHAGDGPELDRFLAMVGRFNARSVEPTAWRLDVRRSADPLATLLAAGDVDVVVLAGRNRGKLARIRALVEAGIHVLADKPWVVEPEDVVHLDAIAGSRAHWADLMTERHEPWAALFAALAANRDVVGAPDPSAGPALTFGTVHHLAKLVDGVPLVRPPWYFDVGVQGEGIIDVTTHLVDQVQRIAGGEPRLLAAQRWATTVPEADYCSITGMPGFPAGLPGVAAGRLELLANGRIDLACGALTAQVQAEWRLRAEDGHGDRHAAGFRGTGAVLAWAGSAGGSSLEVRPLRAVAAVQDAIAAIAPGVPIERSGDVLRLHPPGNGGHEAHFAAVLDGFLAGLERPQPIGERSALIARYRLLAHALEVAR